MSQLFPASDLPEHINYFESSGKEICQS